MNPQRQWIAIAAALGGLALTWSKFQANEPFFGQDAKLWLAAPVALGVVIYKWDDWFKDLSNKKELEKPLVIYDYLRTTDEGKQFAKSNFITTSRTLLTVELFKNKAYRFFIEMNNGERKIILANAIKGGTPIFYACYQEGDWLKRGSRDEYTFINRMLPKEAPDVLDVLESLPEDAKGTYAMQHGGGEKV